MTTKKTDGTEAIQVIKKGRVGNPALVGDNGLLVKSGDNTKFTNVSIHLMNLPKINIQDPEAVQDRLNEYFSFMATNDMKPTVAGMAMALDLDRRRLWEIKTGNFGNTRGAITTLPSEVTDSIKKAYLLMENLWENYMLNGKINPVSGIFLGTNNFGYLNKAEYVVTPNQQNDNDYDADSIRQRYLIDSQSDSDSDSD